LLPGPAVARTGKKEINALKAKLADAEDESD
jgi:hypothetical protein